MSRTKKFCEQFGLALIVKIFILCYKTANTIYKKKNSIQITQIRKIQWWNMSS